MLLSVVMDVDTLAKAFTGAAATAVTVRLNKLVSPTTVLGADPGFLRLAEITVVPLESVVATVQTVESYATVVMLSAVVLTVIEIVYDDG